ncbi:Hypothetical protein NCDO2118_2016 [Lactococcus lactis subsp. lactis NCDO 2118]|uniref:SnoaL-like domain-containing protein n=1 Tax=Lactococcus lactis subsp. lactis NCDO 2118 TaxID=1117941 RepID=A0ABC8A8Z6_LACLL|nr:nuclear transport factor 2 family protein [Lactococcus lactis]ADA65664.1 Hypothetical protein LLKF_2089 [Lactococcus lactis subsp. lactis KF147]AII13471.1 Hypothetical protein NCDO2118_2016 [Lactococcus lactis subsp. lactis NCDO 2118]
MADQRRQKVTDKVQPHIGDMRSPSPRSLSAKAQRPYGVLSEDILWTEYFGAQYQGKAEIEKWFCQWNNPVENKVKSWTVDKYYVDNETTLFTWTFRCFYEGKEGILDGISLVKFSGNKICEIQEFEKNMKNFGHF